MTLTETEKKADISKEYTYFSGMVVFRIYNAINPYGVIINATGTLKDEMKFRFSSKYFEAEINAYYYGMRWYSPELGRWFSRDPIEESGGLLLYGFCGNDGVNNFDIKGEDVIIQYTDASTGTKKNITSKTNPNDIKVEKREGASPTSDLTDALGEFVIVTVNTKTKPDTIMVDGKQVKINSLCDIVIEYKIYITDSLLQRFEKGEKGEPQPTEDRPVYNYYVPHFTGEKENKIYGGGAYPLKEGDQSPKAVVQHERGHAVVYIEKVNDLIDKLQKEAIGKRVTDNMTGEFWADYQKNLFIAKNIKTSKKQADSYEEAFYKNNGWQPASMIDFISKEDKNSYERYIVWKKAYKK